MRSSSGPESRVWYSAAQRVFGPRRQAVARIAGVSAAAGIHRRDQHEARRIGDAVVGARDRDLAGLERLAQRVERRRLELRQFVEEQHAVMRERNLAGPGAQSAADQRGHRRGMMRRAERPPVGERAVLDLARDRRDHRHFEQLRGRQRRQDGRQTRGEHRLAGAGRTDHQQVMTAGGRDLERALGAFLALDVGEIERRAEASARIGSRMPGFGRLSTCVPLK